MSKQIATDSSLKSIKLPRFEELRNDLPDYDDVPRAKNVMRGDPKYSAYEQQQGFDRELFRTLVVGGFGDKLCPKDEEWVAVCLGGAICIALTGEILQPKSCHLLVRESELYFGVWQLVWDRLSSTVLPERIRDSLCRLLVPVGHPGDGPDRGTTDCEAASIWKDFQFCPSSSSFGELALWAYKKGAKLNGFRMKEQAFIQELTNGMAIMREIVEKQIRPLYHW